MKINLRIVLFLASVPLIVSNPCALAHTDVTAEQARDLIESTNDLIVVDVREPSEYCDAIGHIPEALNYPLNSGVLQARYEELPMHGPVLVVCQSGGRSNQASNFLDSKGFSMVYDMLGGMRAWIWETAPCVDPDTKYGGGSGAAHDPYLIYTAEEMNTIGAEPNDWDKHFKLMADINLGSYPGTEFNIIGISFWDFNDIGPIRIKIPFTGTFDGNGHTISNFTYVWIEADDTGIFGYVNDPNAQIRDLGLIDPNVDAGVGDRVGSLVGCLERGTITNCYVKGGRVSADNKVGGLVGLNGGTITNCRASASILGYSSVGGLVGANWEAIANCYSVVSVTGNERVGGLVGDNRHGTINNCYSAGGVTGQDAVGGLVGVTEFGEVTDSFWDIQTSGQTTSAGGWGKTTAEMQMESTFTDAGWDFVDETENGTEDIWSICEGTNYPRLAWQIPAGDFVCPDGITIDDFMFFIEHWRDDNCDISNDYCQGTDLDFSGTVDANDLEIFFENWLEGGND